MFFWLLKELKHVNSLEALSGAAVSSLLGVSGRNLPIAMTEYLNTEVKTSQKAAAYMSLRLL